VNSPSSRTTGHPDGFPGVDRNALAPALHRLSPKTMWTIGPEDTTLSMSPGLPAHNNHQNDDVSSMRYVEHALARRCVDETAVRSCPLCAHSRVLPVCLIRFPLCRSPLLVPSAVCQSRSVLPPMGWTGGTPHRGMAVPVASSGVVGISNLSFAPSSSLSVEPYGSSDLNFHATLWG